ncbi:unnamed protein product [Lupinus luteus]|uniref:Vacuolar ATPase assembly protein VMA22 n=1 Tax=Lupinus luteus TaxID=3873 RepID=A0AAV1W9H3_LUPLU
MAEEKYEIQKEENEENEENEEQLRLQSLPQNEKLVLQFMDSLHSYLSLFDALSSTLRQGWFDLASARYSMGASRINSRLLDLNFHSASTTFKITNYDGTQPNFTLHKWISPEHESAQLEDENKQPQDNNEVTVATLSNDQQVQKEQAKSLSVFGILISPKLRDSQLSFEKALETLVEIANVRSALLYSFHQLHQEVEDAKE